MTDLSIKEVKNRLGEITSKEDEFLKVLQEDDRKGVQKLLKVWEKNYERTENLKQQFMDMRYYEEMYWEQGYQFIGGVDEVGRGPLAGPVIASCVVISKDFFLPGLTDSKKLTKQKREEIFEIIQSEALAIGIGTASAEEIDQHNIYQATKLAMERAIRQIEVPLDYLLLDAMKLPVIVPQTSLIKGDSKSVSIAAASVIAKVTRDSYMEELAVTHPQYGFESNMGYGTKEHLEALKNFGITNEHRQSFAPVKEYSNNLFSY
ncbi:MULTISPECIES: ribonuclease HII [Bacillaceae]|uniref:Ribonuclease HII n=1 Tax=Evansella alkalicola TaxID=745819 RepID=A0ABS6JRF9_9BACI|nr:MULTISPECIES: ribonuclease HII [Bacillaceae]MBU9720299.1 ribonuclease HII [Bacillus alkalicola]